MSAIAGKLVSEIGIEEFGSLLVRALTKHYVPFYIGFADDVEKKATSHADDKFLQDSGMNQCMEIVRYDSESLTTDEIGGVQRMMEGVKKSCRFYRNVPSSDEDGEGKMYIVFACEPSELQRYIIDAQSEPPQTTAVGLLKLANSDDCPSLSADTLDKIKGIKVEKRVENRKAFRKGSGGHATLRAPIRPPSKRAWGQKPSFKPKATSFDEALKQKYVALLNKVTPTRYDDLLKEILRTIKGLDAEYHVWALEHVLGIGAKQHFYVETYMRLYGDISKFLGVQSSKSVSIMKRLIDTHIEAVLLPVSNGTTTDDLCDANKIKDKKLGHSIILGEAVNMGYIPTKVIGGHAEKVVEVLCDVISRSKEMSADEMEADVMCIIQFFATLQKTLKKNPGFAGLMGTLKTIVETEKKEKNLSSRARFALLDFVEAL